ncbi:hypothetical protein HOG48_05105 [Candidatus Peregrinibacteria bacterium]|jgi:DNA/RNA-binding domain of Phe-tRNA-synthetase-like protein|nr:hypothetical protein [Candidatus Peregrinibacteria bacterium]
MANSDTLQIEIQEEALAKGPKVAFGMSLDIKNEIPEKLRNEFEMWRAELLEKIMSDTPASELRQLPEIAAFEQAHRNCGRTTREIKKGPPAPLALRRMALKSGLPEINPAVDIYNLIAAHSLMALGGHDISNLNGNVVSFRLLTGNETFTPLGKPVSENIANKYAYTDTDGGRIICYLEVQQCAETLVSNETTDVLWIIQGNEATSQEVVDKVRDELLSKIQYFLGGESEILN